jgi:hypothetical protein
VVALFPTATQRYRNGVSDTVAVCIRGMGHTGTPLQEIDHARMTKRADIDWSTGDRCRG